MDAFHDLLECSICLETLTLEHKVLPCQHTFCTPCLVGVYEKFERKKRTDPKFEDEAVLCPECRTPCVKRVHELPANVILNRILGGMAGPPNSAQKLERGDVTPKPTTLNWDVPGNPSTNPFLDMMTSPTSVPAASPVPQTGSNLAPLPSPRPSLPPKPAFFPSVQANRPQVPQRPAKANSAPKGAGHQIHEALYNYRPVKADELELVKGQNYVVVERCVDGWYKGYSSMTLKSGVFPGNYVKPINSKDPNILQPVRNENVASDVTFMGSNLASKKAPPPPPTSSPGCSSPDLIDMTPGEMVELFSAAGKATVPPNVASRGQGQIQGHSRKPLPPPPSARAAPRPKYKCIMSFPASTEYELDLKEGDVVILLKKREDGWAKGMLERSGSTGLFPMTFVQLLS